MVRAALFLFAIGVACALLFGQGMGSSVRAVPKPSPQPRRDLPTPRVEAQDIAASAGLTAPNVYGGATSKKHILEMTGNGVAVFDFDNDGRRDLLFVNGTRHGLAPARHRLYRNLESGVFEDVSDGSGLENRGWSQGVCAGDYDNDGDTDLLITGYASNTLYRNAGKGRFEDVTGPVGLATTGHRWATGCAFLDYDRDGRLDIVVSNYVAFDLARAAAPGSSPFCFWKSLSVFCGPKGFPGGQSALYRNEGSRFTDVSKQAGILIDGLRYGLGVVTSDFDNDGWPDIYVACDSTPSILYRNNRDGTFSDVSVEAGTAYGDNGQQQGSMGVAAADYNNDGLIDILRTNFMDETSTLYKNLGEWFFDDATIPAGLGLHTKNVGWGVAFLDFDHDGAKDILIANGHIYPELERAAIGEPYKQGRLLYWNLQNGAFRDISDAAGNGIRRTASSRGLATGDLDGDGALEAVIVNMNEPPSLLRFESDRGNALLVELVGAKSNRSAIGARVSVIAGGLHLVDEVRSGSSFASQSDFRLHFGLGARESVDKLRVRWPSGVLEEVSGVKANQWITIREGAGIVTQRGFTASRR